MRRSRRPRFDRSRRRSLGQGHRPQRHAQSHRSRQPRAHSAPAARPRPRSRPRPPPPALPLLA
eukprot:1597689-Prymnesium_polylepis.1